jgi:hypothetical protein
MFDERVQIVRSLLFDYTRSPSLKHIRDDHALGKLAAEIVNVLDRRSCYWQKWEGQREPLLKAAAHCWVPVEDLRDCLNRLPGPPLTSTDVAQRLRAFHEEPYERYPNQELQESCLALYQLEKAQGTELPAIIGRLQEHVERREEELRVEREQSYRQHAEEERLALEHRFRSGADCKWTPINRSKELYCRINGRAYRLSPAQNKTWNLHRIDSLEHDGVLVGRYGRRGDASKALATIAYQPETR